MLARGNGEPQGNVLLDNIEGATLEDTTFVRLIMSRVGGVLPGMTDIHRWIDRYIDRERERATDRAGAADIHRRHLVPAFWRQRGRVIRCVATTAHGESRRAR